MFVSARETGESANLPDQTSTRSCAVFPPSFQTNAKAGRDKRVQDTHNRYLEARERTIKNPTSIVDVVLPEACGV